RTRVATDQYRWDKIAALSRRTNIPLPNVTRRTIVDNSVAPMVTLPIACSLALAAVVEVGPVREPGRHTLGVPPRHQHASEAEAAIQRIASRQVKRARREAEEEP